ncbi:MAG: Gfo/Idh/MocA family oxidoreductase [Candidatus Yanofskybacteria bacterium]|nr:Gfo/Idh/MocA family oxidoreductase [Candidatus Yanofskybacteria bacterium]
MSNTLLIGTGYMGKEYAKVLKTQRVSFAVVGRSQESTDKFKNELGIDAMPGGIDRWLKTNPVPQKAIIAVTEDQLGIVTRSLIDSGCKSILVEKPGGLDAQDIKKVAISARKKRSKVYVGYNRRFYTSTQKAMEIIRKEGIKSFVFDFTERSNIIDKLPQSQKIKNNWFIQNSTHVIDMAFFLGGNPSKLTAYKKGGLKWHPSGSIYSGAGVSSKGVLFSYHANWESAGRWSLEIITGRQKLIFRPLEKLQAQKFGSMTIEDVILNDKIDTDFKPGIYRQVQSFLGNKENLLTIEEQVKNLPYYKKIAGRI